MYDLMDITEFSPLTRSSIEEVLGLRTPPSKWESCRRRETRWPFPATVELWLPDHGGERHALATCLNLSPRGIGIRTDESLPRGQTISLAVHQPERTLYGQAIVRHCSEIAMGFYVGLEFKFDESDRPARRR